MARGLCPLLRPRFGSRLRLGLDLLGTGSAARPPQHRDPGADEFARRRLGVGVAQGRQAKLHELVVPGGDAEIAVLWLCAVAGQMKRRALEARVRLAVSSMVKLRRR